LKQLLVIILLPVVTGCANTEWLVGNSCNYGYRPEDPKIRCGEKWDQIPNEEFAAQKKAARGIVW
jgi:hypothetical protein